MAAETRGTSGAVTPAPAVVDRAASGGADGETVRPVSGRRRSPTVEQRLFDEGYAFSFFQAVRLLEKLDPARQAVGRTAPPSREVVRFQAHLSLSFPPSEIFEIQPPTLDQPLPKMAVWFMGLTGTSGALPRHYTELLLRIEKEVKGPEKRALRDWLDLFNHRLISLFYRAWEKYRFYIPYERGEHVIPEPEMMAPGRAEPDAFTRAVFSLMGLGLKPLRDRLRVATRVVPAAGTAEDWSLDAGGEERVLARIDDLALPRYGGFLAHRPRNAISLEAMLCDYFQLPVELRQFQGRWLWIEPDGRSRIGTAGANQQMGINLVAGEKVWDIQGKFRVRLGPLSYAEFSEFLPDPAPTAERKAFFLLVHLTRLYAGAEFDFEVQPVLRAAEVPECQLGKARLGWNSWVRSGPMPRHAEDAVFQAVELFTVAM